MFFGVYPKFWARETIFLPSTALLIYASLTCLSTLKDNISILGFWGGDINLRKSEALNLNQKIYKRFYKFEDFQFVFLTTKDQEENIKNLKISTILSLHIGFNKDNNFMFKELTF